MISCNDIFTITQNILTTMLDLEAVPVEGIPSLNSCDSISGCIQISGEWQGAVVIQCSYELASLFASRLFDMDADQLTQADTRDAFAEMTNMIGGNIKGQVPGPSFLSLPSVTVGEDFEFQLVGAYIVREVVVHCASEPLRIMLFEEDELLFGRRVSNR